uniref:Uncharacterized protein n=1 Tax=Hucho hucho TaxID=62062 RepID=A0A4W5JK59_9TELE
MDFSTLTNIQGLHAPLKLQMGFRATRQTRRFPFLTKGVSKLALDTLSGSDESIWFEDIQCELMGESHLRMEYKLGLM